MRLTYAEIDLGAIAHNIAAFRELVEPATVCAVVKADAYGHGDVPVATRAVEAGATCLAVALVEEGVRLREAGITEQVLLLSEPSTESVREIVHWDLTPTVYSLRFLEALEETRVPMGVHVKVDTGMHRVGAAPEDLEPIIERIHSSSSIEMAGLWTHFAVADEDSGYTELQIRRFDETAERVGAPLTHMANTAGSVLFPEARRDLCRIGLGLYGLHPCAETRSIIDLRPAMKLVSHVSHVQRLGPGERPSYGRRRSLEKESTVVTVPVGYADGYARGLSESGVALIRGRRFPLAGTVTMDQLVVDVGDEAIDIGDQVVLLGDQGGEAVTADQWADALNTISYEVVCSIGPRVPRRYVE